MREYIEKTFIQNLHKNSCVVVTFISISSLLFVLNTIEYLACLPTTFVHVAVLCLPPNFVSPLTVKDNKKSLFVSAKSLTPPPPLWSITNSLNCNMHAAEKGAATATTTLRTANFPGRSRVNCISLIV